MNIMPTLIRREFWEHRSLWIVPLVVAALIVVAAMFPHATMRIDPSDVATPQKQVELFAMFHSALTIPQFLLLSLLLPVYLLDCLYAERKDRSILFWKSLPVSDSLTVFSKLLVALAIVPLGVFILTIFTDLAAWLILAVRYHDSAGVRSLMTWNTGVWLRTQGLVFIALVMVMLWYAPIAAFLLLISAWAKRAVYLWALLPPLVAIVVEKIAFRTSYIARIIGYRFNGIWKELGIGHAISGSADPAGAHLTATVGTGAPLALLTNIDLWLGLLLTVVLVGTTVRIRRHQDDS